MRINAQSRLLHPVERFPMSRERLSLTRQQVIRKHVQFSRSHNLRIELANGPGRSVARISKQRLALFFSFSVGSFKHGARNKHFTTHFQFIRHQLFSFEFQRDTSDGAYVLGYLFTNPAVTSSNPTYQDSILVLDGYRQSINL